VLGEYPLGVLLAGQVFDQYPEQLPLEHVAKRMGLPLRGIWQAARREQPVKRATLAVYGRLPATLGQAFLQTRYHTLMEAYRLADLHRVYGELRQSEAQLRHMTDTAPTMLWLTDATGACTFRSQSWQAYTGQPVATGLGGGWLEAVHVDDRAAVRDTFRAAQAQQVGFHMDFRLRRADGVYHWAMDTGQPRWAGSGACLGYIGALIDIDDRKQAEAALHDRELHLRLAHRVAQLGSWQLEMATGTLYASPRSKRTMACRPTRRCRTGASSTSCTRTTVTGCGHSSSRRSRPAPITVPNTAPSGRTAACTGSAPAARS
jgi:PAS domain S-box-containing protein